MPFLAPNPVGVLQKALLPSECCCTSISPPTFPHHAATPGRSQPNTSFSLGSSTGICRPRMAGSLCSPLVLFLQQQRCTNTDPQKQSGEKGTSSAITDLQAMLCPGIYLTHFKGQQKGNKRCRCAAMHLLPLAPGRWEKGVKREHQQAQKILHSSQPFCLSMLCEQSSSKTTDLQQLSHFCDASLEPMVSPSDGQGRRRENPRVLHVKKQAQLPAGGPGHVVQSTSQLPEKHHRGGRESAGT